MNRRYLTGLALAGAALSGCYSGEVDSKGHDGSDERMRNGFISITTAVVADRLYQKASFNGTIGRPTSFNSKLSGLADGVEAYACVESFPRDNCFYGKHVANGLTGNESKHMFDWKITPTGPTTYHLNRVGFDADITILTNDGKVDAYLNSGPLSVDHELHGTIDKNGNFSWAASRMLAFDWTVRGTMQGTRRDEVKPKPAAKPSIEDILKK